MPNNLLSNYLLDGVAGLLVVVATVQFLLLLRKDKPLRKAVSSLGESEQVLRNELAQFLAEARAFHEEVTAKFAALMKLLVPASSVTRSIDEKLDRVREAVEQKLDQAGASTLAVANGQRQDNAASVEAVKQSIIALLDQYTKYQNKAFADSLDANTNNQRAQIATIVEHLTQLIEMNEQKLAAPRTETDARMKRIQAEIAVVARFQAASRAFGAALASGEEEAAPARGNGMATSR